MRVPYYVLAKGQEFEIFRDDLSKGRTTLCSRAIDFAKALARLEARLAQVPTEVLVQIEHGPAVQAAAFDPPG